MTSMDNLIVEYYDHERAIRHKHVSNILRPGHHSKKRFNRKIRSIFPRGKIGDKIPRSFTYISNPIS
jgi:hypothetical protein